LTPAISRTAPCASSRTQIIASTQSVTLANQFSWEDLIVVDRVNDASQFRRLSEAEVSAWLDEFSIGELWEKNIIGGTP
jgi:predicted ATPase